MRVGVSAGSAVLVQVFAAAQEGAAEPSVVHQLLALLVVGLQGRGDVRVLLVVLWDGEGRGLGEGAAWRGGRREGLID